ncbi:protein scabrous-like, partial [Musca vetustissima]|uniref:protein scabrous-like n=1 Tax=Musca vetustissima TaxID=27455 RepID=UPI002AB68820
MMRKNPFSVFLLLSLLLFCFGGSSNVRWRDDRPEKAFPEMVLTCVGVSDCVRDDCDVDADDDLDDSEDDVFVMQLILSKLIELPTATSKINNEMKGVNKRFSQLEKNFDDVNKKFDGISKTFEEFKVDVFEKFQDQEQRFNESMKSFGAFNESIKDLSSRVENSIKGQSTIKTDILQIVKENNDVFHKDVNNRISDISGLHGKLAAEVSTFKNDILTKLNQHSGSLNKLEKGIEDFQKRQENQIKTLWENGSLEKKSSWTTVLRRQDGSVNFNRKWLDYKNGFGNRNSEFFIGMETLHNLTSNGFPHEILITLTDINDVQTFARYDNIVIGSEAEKYELKELGVHSGSADDALRHHEGEQFTTIDRDNDHDNRRNCAEVFMGPWWYYQCNPSSQLFGPYESHKYGQGLR